MNKQERTQAILDNFRGNPEEFAMLKGVLCMSHGPCKQDFRNEYRFFGEHFDTIMLAERMDELNRAAMEAYVSLPR